MKAWLRRLEFNTGGVLPPAVSVFLGINLLAFFILIPTPGLSQYLDLNNRVWQGEIWRLLTASFVHLQPMHFLGNALTFGFLAHFAHERLGQRSFIAFVLGSAVLANFAHLLVPYTFNSSAMGFSGVVYAVVIAAAAWFPYIRIWGFIPLWLIALIMAFLSAASFAISLRNGASDGIAHDIHFFGALLGFCTAHFNWRWRWRLPNLFGQIVTWQEQRNHERTAAQEQKLDELLAKVSRDGLHSLSDAERRFLKRYSEQKNAS